ncbi:MAG TPA: hypothetical protein VFR10_01010, partial [bacterium]|nr:hypothetical protein [bacterium]
LQNLGEATGGVFHFDPAEAGQIIFRARTVEHRLPSDVQKAKSAFLRQLPLWGGSSFVECVSHIRDAAIWGAFFPRRTFGGGHSLEGYAT